MIDWLFGFGGACVGEITNKIITDIGRLGQPLTGVRGSARGCCRWRESTGEVADWVALLF